MRPDPVTARLRSSAEHVELAEPQTSVVIPLGIKSLDIGTRGDDNLSGSPNPAIDKSATPMRIGRLPMRISKIRVTALEVARQAGVSQPTVSLVLSRNPKARVAPETRARVLKAAEELGYRPNRLAQGLVHRRSFALGPDKPIMHALLSV